MRFAHSDIKDLESAIKFLNRYNGKIEFFPRRPSDDTSIGWIEEHIEISFFDIWSNCRLLRIEKVNAGSDISIVIPKMVAEMMIGQDAQAWMYDEVKDTP